jgi:IS1 family transposase
MINVCLSYCTKCLTMMCAMVNLPFMKTLPIAKRAQIIGMLCEGMSMRAASRLADVSNNTVTKLLVETGMACSDYQDRALMNLKCNRLQLDEIWSFVGKKARNASGEDRTKGLGDVWTWTAIDAETKLIPSWYVGDRTSESALIFVSDLRKRLSGRVQITTDGHRAYLSAIDAQADWEVDYARLIKHYGPSPDANERRYSPAECIGTSTEVVRGVPEYQHVSTSYAERANLTLRMGCRRFTRLTNAFSKKVENHAWAVSLHLMHYNFARVHKTLRITPAMAAGVADHVWSPEELAELGKPVAPTKRGPYQKRSAA